MVDVKYIFFPYPEEITAIDIIFVLRRKSMGIYPTGIIRPEFIVETRWVSALLRLLQQSAPFFSSHFTKIETQQSDLPRDVAVLTHAQLE